MNCVEWGFGYGESEYEASFGLAPRNVELSPSDPETSGRFNSPFRLGTRNPEFGVGRSKLGVRGHIYPETKGQWLYFLLC